MRDERDVVGARALSAFVVYFFLFLEEGKGVVPFRVRVLAARSRRARTPRQRSMSSTAEVRPSPCLVARVVMFHARVRSRAFDGRFRRER